MAKNSTEEPDNIFLGVHHLMKGTGKLIGYSFWAFWEELVGAQWPVISNAVVIRLKFARSFNIHQFLFVLASASKRL